VVSPINSHFTTYVSHIPALGAPPSSFFDNAFACLSSVGASVAPRFWDARKEAIYVSYRTQYRDDKPKKKDNDQPQGTTQWKRLLKDKDTLARRVAEACEEHAASFLALRQGQNYFRAT
jgi:hypothetical protein